MLHRGVHIEKEEEVTFRILLYAGTVSGRKGLKTLIFEAGVDGFVAIGVLGHTHAFAKGSYDHFILSFPSYIVSVPHQRYIRATAPELTCCVHPGLAQACEWFPMCPKT